MGLNGIQSGNPIENLRNQIFIEELRQIDPEQAECYEMGRKDCGHLKIGWVPVTPGNFGGTGLITLTPKFLGAIGSLVSRARIAAVGIGIAPTTSCIDDSTLREAPEPYLEPSEEHIPGSVSLSNALQGCAFSFASEESVDRFVLSEEMDTLFSNLEQDLVTRFTTNPHPDLPTLSEFISGDVDMTGRFARYNDETPDYAYGEIAFSSLAFGNRLYEYENEYYSYESREWDFPTIACEAGYSDDVSSQFTPEKEVYDRYRLIFAYDERNPSTYYRRLIFSLKIYSESDKSIFEVSYDGADESTDDQFEMETSISSEDYEDPVAFALAEAEMIDLVEDQLDDYYNLVGGYGEAVLYFPAPED